MTIATFRASVSPAVRNRFDLAYNLGEVVMVHTDDVAEREYEKGRFAAAHAAFLAACSGEVVVEEVFPWQTILDARQGYRLGVTGGFGEAQGPWETL